MKAPGGVRQRLRLVIRTGQRPQVASTCPANSSAYAPSRHMLRFGPEHVYHILSSGLHATHLTYRRGVPTITAARGAVSSVCSNHRDCQ
jgi:hypothetical protein